MNNCILLVDMDNFFASVEEIDNPKYIGKPLVVGGRLKGGVVAAASASAKKLGIKAAMPIFKALEICPNLIVVNSNMNKYASYSKKVHNILKKFTSNIEKASIDEWYVDFSNKKDFFNRDIEEIARTIKYRIEKELGLKCSIGISYNKFLSKMASGLAKPNGIFVLDQSNIKEKLWPMDISEMYMVGKKASIVMNDISINTIGDLANYKDKELLKQKFGKLWVYYFYNANGQDIIGVEPERQMKTISNSTTFPEPIDSQELFLKEVNNHFEILYENLINDNYLTNSVTVRIGYKKHKTPNTFSFSFFTSNKDILYETVINLFNDLYIYEPLDYLGITFNNLKSKFNIGKQESIFKASEQDLVTEINSIFGKEIINSASKKLKK